MDLKHSKDTSDFTHRSALGELEVQRVDALQNSLGLVQRCASLLRQISQHVPLVADALAARVDGGRVVVVESTAEERHNIMRENVRKG